MHASPRRAAPGGSEEAPDQRKGEADARAGGDQAQQAAHGAAGRGVQGVRRAQLRGHPCAVAPAAIYQPCPKARAAPADRDPIALYQSSCSNSRPARTRAGPASTPPAARLRGRLRGARQARRQGCLARCAPRGPQRCLQAPPCAFCEACEPLLQSCSTASLLACARVLARPSAERCLSVTAGSACARNAHALRGLSTAVTCMAKCQHQSERVFWLRSALQCSPSSLHQPRVKC